MSEPSADFIRSILDYDPATGIFRWRDGYARCVKGGRIAGRVNGKGYASISVAGKHKASHRLAWLYVYGEWPDKTICVDHINGNKTDNRIANLRLATSSQNAQNRQRALEGKKGATYHKRLRKWQAQIAPNNGVIYLGLFDTEEEAHQAYVKAAAVYYGEFARAG